MHLCERCTSLRNWETDPVIRTKIDLNARQPARLRHRCMTCRVFVNIPLFPLCALCAARDRLCQHCNKTTLSSDEQATVAAQATRNEKFERLLDIYTLVVKQTTGVGSNAARIFRERYAGVHAATLEVLLPGDLDRRLEDRPVLKILYCNRSSNAAAQLYCDRCQNESRPPAFAAGQNCGHFALAYDQAWCLHCALEQKRCATCDVSTDP